MTDKPPPPRPSPDYTDLSLKEAERLFESIRNLYILSSRHWKDQYNRDTIEMERLRRMQDRIITAIDTEPNYRVVIGFLNILTEIVRNSLGKEETESIN